MAEYRTLLTHQRSRVEDVMGLRKGALDSIPRIHDRPTIEILGQFGRALGKESASRVLERVLTGIKEHSPATPSFDHQAIVQTLTALKPQVAGTFSELQAKKPDIHLDLLRALYDSKRYYLSLGNAVQIKWRNRALSGFRKVP